MNSNANSVAEIMISPPDGQRFLTLKAYGSDATGAPPQIVVVQHFDEELKRLVPSK